MHSVCIHRELQRLVYSGATNMFMIQGTSVNIWMQAQGQIGIPDFGHNFYVDDLNQHYVDDEDNNYQDGM